MPSSVRAVLCVWVCVWLASTIFHFDFVSCNRTYEDDHSGSLATFMCLSHAKQLPFPLILISIFLDMFFRLKRRTENTFTNDNTSLSVLQFSRLWNIIKISTLNSVRWFCLSCFLFILLKMFIAFWKWRYAKKYPI